MLQVYYSTLEKQRELKDTSKSLGGYISSNSFKNNKLNSLFPICIDKSIVQSRLLVIKNSFTETKEVTISCSINEGSTELLSISYGLVQPSLNSCGELIFEVIDEGESPLYCEFQNSLNNPITFNLDVGKYIGIWLKKEYLNTSIDIVDTSECGGKSLEELSDSLIDSFTLSLEAL